jgi:ligand-binding sensor domain-containing protein/signal transduction histidine kinase
VRLPGTVWKRNFAALLTTVILPASHQPVYQDIGCPPARARLGAGRVLAGCFLLLAMLGPARANDAAGLQDPSYVVFDWQVQDGLPSARIHDVIQTHDGYIWLATLDGLARFDGVRFQRYYDSDTPGLASSMICCLMEDHQGRLWYGTESGEIGWKGPDGFHRVDLPPSRLPDPVERIVQTGDGTVWVASRNSLLPVRDGVAGTRVVRPASHFIWDICTTENGDLWVLVDEGNVFKLNPQTGKMTLVIPGQSGEWRNITPARAGGLWVRDGQCIRRWQGNGWVEDLGVVDLQVTENVVLHETRSGLLMIGTYGQGVWLVSPDGHQHLLDHGSRLSQDQVLSLCEDREQNLWVGTVHGLNRLSRRVVSMITPADNWQNRAISTVAPAKAGGFWVGTEGAGLYRISTDGQVLFHQSDDIWHRDYVRCVLEDAGGQIWTGVFSYGLRLRDKTHPVGQNLRNPTAGYPNALFQDSRRAVWVGTTLGAARYAQSALEPAQTMLTNSDVRCFAEAANGSIWLGLQEGGLCRYDPGARQASQVRTEFIHSSVHSLHCAADGTLWVGTWRDGLTFLKNGHWGALTHDQGLPDDSISDIRSDEAGNLWVGSASGIFRINRRQLEQYTAGNVKSVNCLQLGSGDGLGTWEILGGYQPIACRTDDGRLWYVTSVGLAVVDPKAIRQNELPPPVVIESMLADGRTIEPPNPELPKAVATCPAGTRQLEIHYTALSLSAPKQVRFRYRLVGLDKKWVEAADQRLAYFSHLPPGKYSFEVTACNNHGVWNDTGAKLMFVVLPLYWQTVWFKLLIALAVLALIVFFYRVRQLRLRALERLRQQIARDLHDEVGANLGSISLLTEVMEQHPQPGDLAQIRSTADQTVDTLRDLVWIINPTHEHLADLVARLRQIASIMLANVRYDFAEAEEPENIKLSLELRRNIPPFLKETLNNIRKHSHARRVDIRLYCSGGNLILEVKDDGVGFQVDQKRPGDGLKNFQHRAAEMRAQVTITSQPGAGTTIRLVAPLPNTRDWWKPIN